MPTETSPAEYSRHADARQTCPLSTEHHSVFCPNCSARLADHRCKLICRNCGYFLSCADFY